MRHHADDDPDEQEDHGASEEFEAEGEEDEGVAAPEDDASDDDDEDDDDNDAGGRNGASPRVVPVAENPRLVRRRSLIMTPQHDEVAKELSDFHKHALNIVPVSVNVDISATTCVFVGD